MAILRSASSNVREARVVQRCRVNRTAHHGVERVRDVRRTRDALADDSSHDATRSKSLFGVRSDVESVGDESYLAHRSSVLFGGLREHSVCTQRSLLKTFACRIQLIDHMLGS